MKYLTAAAVVVGLSIATAPVHAANVNANNLISVDVSNVANDIARDLDVNVSQIPVTVQVPVGIAAAVCDVSANVLAQQADDAEPCSATSTSNALNKVAQKQMISQ